MTHKPEDLKKCDHLNNNQTKEYITIKQFPQASLSKV